MKLLSCYIAGFGKWRNQAFDFNKDIIEIKAENGFGKTTLLNFLECMLFGMDAGRNKALEDNLRSKYHPFDGGVYGGTLTGAEAVSKSYPDFFSTVRSVGLDTEIYKI